MRKFIFILLAALMLQGCTSTYYERDTITTLEAMEKDVDNPERYHDVSLLPDRDSLRLSAEFREQVSPQFERKCVRFFNKLIDAYILIQGAKGEENGLIGTFGITFEDILRVLDFGDERNFGNRLVEESAEFGFSAQLVAESLNRLYSTIIWSKSLQSHFEDEVKEPSDNSNGTKRDDAENYSRVVPLRYIARFDDEDISSFDLEDVNSRLQYIFEQMDRGLVVCLTFFE